MQITRSESTAIKGILIILIILGHFQPYIKIPVFIRGFIYEFHVSCFFILPLLYPIKQLSHSRIKNYFARLMIPYILLFIIFFICSLLWRITHTSLSEQNVMNYLLRGINTLIMGGYYPMMNTIKLRYLWFLPLMFSFSIIKDYYFTDASKRMKYCFLVIGLVFYCILWVCLKGPYCSELRETVMNLSPLSIWQAVGALFMGVTTIYLLKVIKIDLLSSKVTVTFLFIVLFVLYVITPPISIYLLPLISIIPIIAFIVLYSYKDLFAKSKILRKFGEHSFEIYIVQTPICIVMYTFLPKIISNDSILVRIISFVLVVAICYYTAKMLLNISIVKRFLFPRTWDELMGRS